MEEAVNSLQFDLLANKISHPYITALIVMLTCEQKTSVSYVGFLVDKKFLEKYFSRGFSFVLYVLLFFLRTSSGTNCMRRRRIMFSKTLPSRVYPGGG